MGQTINRRFEIAAYPKGMPSPECFRLREGPVTEPAPGEVLVRTLYLSIDPSPRLRLQPVSEIGADFVLGPPLPLGSIMLGRGIGEVLRSAVPAIAEGSFVFGDFGWQTHPVVAAAGLRPVDASAGSLPDHLTTLGGAGVSAYLALTELGQPQPGETVVVSSAAGGVGSIAGQIARILGCRAVGIAGGAEKTSYLVRELGFAAAVDYRDQVALGAGLAAACPDGVDVFFDNVGGAVFDAMIPLLTVRGRVALCGTISNYNNVATEGLGPRHNLTIIQKRARLSGFLVGDYADRFEAVRQRLAGWLADGSLRSVYSIEAGFEKLPEAFARLFTSGAIGKLLVEVAPP